MNLKLITALVNFQPVTHLQRPGTFDTGAVKLDLATIHSLCSQTACFEKPGSPQPLVDAYGLSQLLLLPVQAARQEPLRRDAVHR